MNRPSSPGRSRCARPVAAGALFLLALNAATIPAAARQLPTDERGIAPYLPVQHWTAHAARRLHALGLVPDDFDPGLRSRNLAEWRHILATALRRSERDAGRHELVRGYVDRFVAEFGEAAAPAAASGRQLAGTASTAMVVDAGRVRTGVGFHDGDWTGVRSLDDVHSPEARVQLKAAWRERVAAGFEAAVREPGSALDEAYLAAAWRALGAWAGRRAPGYGPGAGGGLVLSGELPFTGVGAQLNRGYLLPSVLRVLGPVRLEGFVARADNMHKPPGSVDQPFRPYFGAARISGSPVHRRLTLSASRGAMFGGEDNAPLNLRNFVRMLYGNHAGQMGEFHHEVFAVDASFRPPIGSVPLLLRMEWAMDDASGMFYRAPAVSWAVELGALPGVPAASFGFERTLFSGCFECKNTFWYRNWYFREGWTDGGRLLGHPLGGHGREHRFYGSLEPAHVPVSARGTIALRERRAENLLVPERRGRSRFVEGRLHWWGVRRVFVEVDASHERGAQDWTETRFTLRAGFRF